MRKFNVANDFTGGSLTSLTNANKTHLSGGAATTNLRRGRIVEIAIGPVGNPVVQDCNIIYAVQKCTALGTSTSVTPAWVYTQEAGSDTPVAGSVWGAQHSVEPTYTSGQRVWTKALNQHSGFIWYSPDEQGLPWPAVNASGLGCVARGATADYTSTVLWEVKFEE